MKLKGRTALVTGGSRGIGRAVALALAEEGADVAVNYVSSEPAARDVVETIKKIGRKAVLAQADVSDYPDTFRMAQDVLREFGHLDILVNNAGINSDTTFVKMNHAEMLTYPNVGDQVMFGSVAQAVDLGAAGVGATIYFGAQESMRQLQEVTAAFE